MLFVDNQGVNDPHLNLAIEEYLLRYMEDGQTFLLFYINAPSVIIGRNQNTHQEINLEYIEEHGVHVVRRLSGGGAVYHDLGNLNFSFITKYVPGSFNDFETFTKPVVQVLRALGVPAELSGRNDILVAGRKVSGNAQYKTGGRMFSHGTLLFDTNLADVVAALNVKQGKIASKGIKSVRSRVANIKEFLDTEMDIEEFKRRLLQGIFNTEINFPSYVLTDQDWEKIHQIKADRYDLWTWNFGKSPKFNVQKSHRFPIGEIDVRIDVAQGKIKEMQIYGDFLGGEHETRELADLLLGVRYETAAVTAALAGVDVAIYFGSMTNSDFIKLLF